MSHISKELMEVIEYSKAMLRDAEDGNWESVIATEARRNTVLNRTFSKPLSNKEQQDNNEKILQILAINKNLESVTSQARENIREKVGSISKGRQAVGVYAQNAG